MDPIQFISTGASGNEFALCDDAVAVLEREARPVTVICIVGPYRPGKSYLLNRLMGKNNGFPLGPTLQAKTKGIWIWVGDYFDDRNRAMVLLDTEGLDDPEKGDASHDMNMFAISLLLSSVFIYNTKGTIDAKSLDGLHYATEISSFMSADSKNRNLNEGQNLSQHFPSFIWAIRDHHLKLEIDGEAVSSNEYLEFCLKSKPGFSPSVIQYNGLRDALRAFFKERSCFSAGQRDCARLEPRAPNRKLNVGDDDGDRHNPLRSAPRDRHFPGKRGIVVGGIRKPDSATTSADSAAAARSCRR